MELSVLRQSDWKFLTGDVGHVPPSPGTYFPECVSIPDLFNDEDTDDGLIDDLDTTQYVRYVELSLRFQDIILGHLYGVSLEIGSGNDIGSDKGVPST